MVWLRGSLWSYTWNDSDVMHMANLWLTGESGSVCRHVDELQDQNFLFQLKYQEQPSHALRQTSVSSAAFFWSAVGTSDHTLNDYFVI